MANKVTPDAVSIDQGLKHLFSFNWLYGFCLSIALYLALNFISPDEATLIAAVVPGTARSVDGISIETDSERQVEYRTDAKPSMEFSGAKEVGLIAAV
jgi:nucleobase:cation symporter-1, NCS1 family